MVQHKEANAKGFVFDRSSGYCGAIINLEPLTPLQKTYVVKRTEAKICIVNQGCRDQFPSLIKDGSISCKHFAISGFCKYSWKAIFRIDVPGIIEDDWERSCGKCDELCPYNPDCKYVLTFRATGCSNKKPYIQWWKTRSDSRVFFDMFAYCKYVRDGYVLTNQKSQCCGKTLEAKIMLTTNTMDDILNWIDI